MKSFVHYLRVLRSHPTPFRLLAGRVLQKSRMSRFFTIDYPDFRLRFFPTNASALYWIDRKFIEHDASIIRRFARPGETVVDVGANIGALSLVASTAVGPLGRVVAVEPHPKTFSYLQQNVRLNRRENIVALNCAAGATAGTLSFSDLSADDRNAVIERGGLQVPVETLDALLDGWPGPIALLKVDVEGFEKYVFEGARRVLERTECVYFEADERNYARYGYGTGEIIALLAQHGFHTVRSSLAAVERVDADYVATGLENLIAVRDLAHLHCRPHEQR